MLREENNDFQTLGGVYILSDMGKGGSCYQLYTVRQIWGSTWNLGYCHKIDKVQVQTDDWVFVKIRFSNHPGNKFQRSKIQ